MTSPAPGVYLPGSQAAPSARFSEAIGRPADRRTGTVVAFSAGVLTVSVGGGEPEDVGYLSSYAPVVGDVVCLVLQRTTWLCIGRLNDSTSVLPPSSESNWFAGPSGSNNTSTYAVVTGTGITFTKRRPESRVYVHLAGSGFSASAASGGEYAARIAGLDFSMAQFFWNNAAEHHSFSGFRHLSGIAAGTYTVQVSFRLYNGVGAIQYDAHDRFSLLCWEVD